MNSTPLRPASTIRLTAFEPPPPTPTTLMTARYEVSIGWSLLRQTCRATIKAHKQLPESTAQTAKCQCALRLKSQVSVETSRVLTLECSDRLRVGRGSGKSLQITDFVGGAGDPGRSARRTRNGARGGAGGVAATPQVSPLRRDRALGHADVDVAPCRHALGEDGRQRLPLGLAPVAVAEAYLRRAVDLKHHAAAVGLPTRAPDPVPQLLRRGADDRRLRRSLLVDDRPGRPRLDPRQRLVGGEADQGITVSGDGQQLAPELGLGDRQPLADGDLQAVKQRGVR